MSQLGNAKVQFDICETDADVTKRRHGKDQGCDDFTEELGGSGISLEHDSRIMTPQESQAEEHVAIKMQGVGVGEAQPSQQCNPAKVRLRLLFWSILQCHHLYPVNPYWIY